MGGIGVSPLKRSPMATPLFLHLILLTTLVAASCGEAARMLLSAEPVKMGVAVSYRRELAGDNATALNATTNLSEDAEVLLLLKAALTSDPYNVTRYWKPIGKRQLINPCRPWLGITCTRRRVTAINLFNQSLGGALSPALGRLSALRTLNLSQNRFTGPIPELTFASSLQVLDLGNNLFNGALPSSLENLTNLTSLVVANNGLTGAIPATLSNLQQLRELNVSGNELSGAFPAAVGSLLHLETLDFSGNNVSGAIPVGIGSMVNLTVFDARRNALSGGLPAALGSCVALTRLDVSENAQLAGSVPAALGNLTRLESLRMRRCGLSGAIPRALTGCVALREVDLSENALQGEVPFQGLKNLTVMRLGSNRLEGEFVSRLPTFTRLEDLDVMNNRLNGSIPDGIGSVPLQVGLLLGSNRLSGVIPSALGELALVKRIDLSENQLSGGIPAAIQNCISLTELHLASNALTGGFAVAAGTLPALTTLNISHNFLNGTLPTLNHLTNLKLFDGSFNGFSGGIPVAFVDFPSLQSLNVSSNRLAGEVPPFTPHDNVTSRSFLNNTGLCGASLGIECGSGNNKLSTSTIIYIAVGSAGGIFILVALILFLVRSRKGWTRKGSKHSAQVSAELQLKLTPEEVAAATDGFNASGYIGEGKMSTVHRGVLPDQRVVAVKRLTIDSADHATLDAELEALGYIRHKSLVKVLGYCPSAQSKALVLEYMPHGSLAGLLHSPQNEEVNRAFDWTIRFTIAVEVAEGLKYLHAECRHPVVHGDLKPSNILFNASMEARVADFGIRRILAELGVAPTDASPSTAAHGYTPAEVASTGVPTMKGDVYSFGILLLSMLTGKDPTRLDPSQTLPQWVRATVANSKALQHVLDPVLMQDLAAHQQRMAMVLGVALLCTRSEPQDRPHMSDVHKMLVHIRSNPNAHQSGRRKISRRRSAREVQLQALPHTPSLSDWTPPPSQV